VALLALTACLGLPHAHHLQLLLWVAQTEQAPIRPQERAGDGLSGSPRAEALWSADGLVRRSPDKAHFPRLGVVGYAEVTQRLCLQSGQQQTLRFFLQRRRR